MEDIRSYVADRDVYSMLTDVRQQLRRLPPDGKIIHKKNSIIGLIEGWRAIYPTQERGETFTRLSRRDPLLYGAVINKLNEAVSLGVML